MEVIPDEVEIRRAIVLKQNELKALREILKALSRMRSRQVQLTMKPKEHVEPKR